MAINGDAIRKALETCYENGNRRMMRETDVTDAGGSSNDWFQYALRLAIIEEAARDWCEVYFAPDHDDEELKRIESLIIDNEKAIYSWIKTEETKAYFHATSRDGAYIGSLADSFLQKKNNTSFEENFRSARVHAPARHADFVKKFENHLGTKIDAQSFMSVEHAAYIQKEAKFLGKVKSFDKNIKEKREEIKQAKAKASTKKDDAIREYFEEEARNFEAELEKLLTLRSKAYKDMSEYIEKHADALDEPESIRKALGVTDEDIKKLEEEIEKAKQEATPVTIEVIMAMSVNRMKKDQIIAELNARGVSCDESANTKTLKAILKDVRKNTEAEAGTTQEEVA